MLFPFSVVPYHPEDKDGSDGNEMIPNSDPKTAAKFSDGMPMNCSVMALSVPVVGTVSPPAVTPLVSALVVTVTAALLVEISILVLVLVAVVPTAPVMDVVVAAPPVVALVVVISSLVVATSWICCSTTGCSGLFSGCCSSDNCRKGGF